MKPLALVLLVGLAAPCSGETGAPAESETPRSDPGESRREGTAKGELVEVGLRTTDGARRYFVYTPKAYDPAKAWPVLLVLHGGGGSAEGAAQASLTTASAERHGFIAVYPEGIATKFLGKTLATWNSGQCCGEAVERGIDDVAFIAAVLDDLARTHHIDPARVFTTGISNGGMMSERLACELPERIAAFAAVASPGYRDCKATHPVAALVIHGTDDPCARYDGGEACGGCWERAVADTLGTKPRERSFPCDGAATQVARWRKVDRCRPTTKTVFARGAATCVETSACTGDTAVTLCTLDGGGHTWPGQQFHCREGGKFCEAYKKAVGPINHDLVADDVILDFFAHHPRSR